MPKSGIQISSDDAVRLAGMIGKLIDTYEANRKSDLIRARRDMYRNSWFSRSRANLSDEAIWSEIEDSLARAAFGGMSLPWFFEIDMSYRPIKQALSQLKSRLEKVARFGQPIWLEMADLDCIPADWIAEATARSPFRYASGLTPLLVQVPRLLSQIQDELEIK